MKYNVIIQTEKRQGKKKAGAGRPFKLDVKNRFLMLLVYYRLYIHTHGWVFSLIWIKVTFVEIYKRLKG